MKIARKICSVICIILVVILIKLISCYAINESFISGYKQGTYSKDALKFLSIANIYEPYVVYYNEGNSLYKKANYSEAIEKYEKALTMHPPKYKECSIRINLALAMIKNIESKEDAKVEEIQEVLKNAKNVLCEKGCAHQEDDNGHSEKAEQLKKDIEDYEKSLKNKKESEEDDKKEENNKDDNNDEKKNQENSNVDEKKLKEKESKLRKQQKQNGQARQEQLDRSEGLANYEIYRGKQW